MTTPLIDRLEALGVLQAVDAALGRLLAVKSADAGEALCVAAALVSAALARGHSCLPLAAVHDFAADLAIDAEAKLPPRLPTVEALRAALSASPLVARDTTGAAALVFDAEERIYLRRYYVYEQIVAEALRARLADSSLAGDVARIDPPALRAALAQPAAARSRSDDLDQRVAVLLALRSRFLIISGGPGSGKTTTVLRLLSLIVETAHMHAAPSPRIALAAPTGKAAARLSETLRARAGDADSAIPAAAATVHRLLGLNPSSGRARFDRRNPLPYDLVVIDEASMLDLALAARLCEALAPPTRLILLGDRDQLAAVEAGRVFGALSHAAGDTAGYSPGLAQWLENSLLENVDVAAAPNALADAYVELRGNHRFTAQSAIGRLAVALRRGDVENALSVLYEGRNEALMLPVTAAELAQRTAAEIVPRYAELAGAADADAAFAVADRFRVLCALREGPFGARALNAEVERELRRRSGVGADEWYAGRLVIVGGNDYRLGLFNGDIGVALPSGTDGALEVWFRNADGSLRALPPLVLSACEPAYALTVHKAQGSEFDEVAVVLPERESRVLTRELVYTAVTRARKKVRLWASADILAKTMARSTQRWSGLAAALTR